MLEELYHFIKSVIKQTCKIIGETKLSTLSKLFTTKIFNSTPTSWAKDYGIYIEAQAGFRQHMSTVDTVLVLNSLISHALNSGKKLYCSFIDLSKAFDYVVTDILWHKYLNIGVRGKLFASPYKSNPRFAPNI